MEFQMDETQPLCLPDRSNTNYLQREGLEEDAPNPWECNVCLEEVREPIVTQCGHLFCWPCLYRWLHTGHTTCPTCKAGVNEENIIPLFIRGSEETTKTQTGGVPSRPNANRPEAGIPSSEHMNGNDQNSASFSTGFGFFPSLFGLQFQSFIQPIPSNNDRPMTSEEVQHVFMSKILVALGTFVIICLLLF